jgi:hypothetical protein
MKANLTYILIAALVLYSCNNNGKKCNDLSCKTPLACKLTTAEMRERKATVIASLQKQILEKKELNKGYTFKFKEGEGIHKELEEFMKSEKECCSFFDFKVSETEDKSAIWLDITGPEGAKKFIKTELGLI